MPYPITNFLFAHMLMGWMIYMTLKYPPITPRTDPKPTQADRRARDIEMTSSGVSILLHLPKK